MVKQTSIINPDVTESPYAKLARGHYDLDQSHTWLDQSPTPSCLEEEKADDLTELELEIGKFLHDEHVFPVMVPTYLKDLGVYTEVQKFKA